MKKNRYQKQIDKVLGKKIVDDFFGYLDKIIRK